MKKQNRIILFFLLSLFFFSVEGYAQYNQLIDENKEWVVKERLEDFSNIFPDEIRYRFTYFRGDTTLNGITYKKLYHQFFYRSYWDFSTGSPTEVIDNVLKRPVLVAFLREDVLDKQVFVIENYSAPLPSEELLFDFSLNVGDTLQNNFTAMFGFYGNAEIDSIGSILIGNSSRSIHYFDGGVGVVINDLNANYMIEGIGGPGGIINSFYFIALGFNLDDEIVCYRENGDSLFSHCNYPDFVTGIGEEFESVVNLEVYPNPGNGQLIIEHSLINTGTLSLDIIDVQGKKQSFQQINSSKKAIDTSALPQGIYFIQLKNAEGIVATRKWVKTQ